MAAKHPTAWVEFETGAITEQQLLAKFFTDGRSFDGPGLVQHMVRRAGRVGPGEEAGPGAGIEVEAGTGAGVSGWDLGWECAGAARGETSRAAI
jgi:hypothetical protein